MKFYWIINEVCKIKREIPSCLEAQVGKERVLKAFEGLTSRERKYHVWPLFQIFLNQVASGSSCGASIAWGIAHRLLPLKTSPKTSAFCNAKTRMPEKPIFELMKSVGTEIESHTHKNRMVFGRNVKVVDGTSVQLPDSESNQKAYPQPDAQKPGCGQPHMKLCVLMGLGTGAIIDCVVDQYKVHERTMFRRLWRSLVKGDILLGDRGFGSYAEVAMLLRKGVDFVFRQAQGSLKTKGLKKIGNDQWIVSWKRSYQLGDWVNKRELPHRVEIRAIRFRTRIKGYRPKEIILFTSLTDPVNYPKDKLIELYYRRWEMELRIRDIKSTMGMNLLKSKTPSGARKELWMGLLAYNLVRGIMLDAALRGRLPVSRMSFKTTLNRLDIFSSGRFADGDPQRAYLLLLDYLIETRVPDRPGRIEPRLRKRRLDKKYTFLTIPRNAASIEAFNA
jgi:hypothetical protein